MTSKHLLIDFNNIRQSKGLELCEENGLIDIAAKRHVEWMTRNGLSHFEGLYGPVLGQRLDIAGFEWKSCAENIAFGQDTIEEVLKKWMESPEHRQNMLSNFKYASIYSSSSPSGKLYWIMVLAS